MANIARDWNFEGEEFEQLLKEVESYLIAATKHGLPDLLGLRDEIKYVACWYYADAWIAEESKRINLHEVREPVARIVDILKNDANHGLIYRALAGNADGSVDLDYATKRCASLVADLEKIATAATNFEPPREPPYRPPRVDLRLLVGYLANYWVCTTDAQFTQNWHKGEPLTPSAQFVYAIVKFLNSESLSALPSITEWIVRERREGNVCGWFDDEGRRGATSVKSKKRR